MAWVNPLTLPSWELPWLGKASAAARRGVSKTRCASPWQSSCMKEMWNVITSQEMSGPWLIKDQGQWMDQGTVAVRHCSARALSGLNSTCHSNRRTTDVIQLPGGKPWEHPAFSSRLTDFPVGADFSAAWPILGGLSLLQPQAVHLFLYLHRITYVSK